MLTVQIYDLKLSTLDSVSPSNKFFKFINNLRHQISQSEKCEPTHQSLLSSAYLSFIILFRMRHIR